ncbi:MAG TPA: sigma-54 dependent transcriptional regulator [Candidatus Methylomirabilis sp.]|nr:sigma-54 dependent transcriptional regulator [Candidatus Methylomirabilis sp.]HSB78859.1 sigma-54 dependent transcriptional regulator [Candidatus Methylomirabilis sp.]
MDTPEVLVLVVDDDAATRRLLDVRLRAMGCEVAAAADGREALIAIQREVPALMLLDLQMPRMGGMELLRELRKGGVDLPVIVITAHGSIEAAVEAMKEGAIDFLPKPFDPKHLEIVVHKALERRKLVESNRFLQDTLAARTPAVLGESAPIRRAIEIARKAAAANSTVLLLGESGTGKEVFAHSIHQWSPRQDRPFVVVNCVALSEHLLESELFGHEKGAFTGAHATKKGKFELAHSGTVFLDEIGDMPPNLQTKLLRVLQDHAFERVGGTKPFRADIRIIAATNRDLDGAVKDGRFREDLYYRLNVVRIVLPPLRDRMDDLPALAHHFVARFAMETKKAVKGISKEAMTLLLAQAWRGNIRELANVIERAVVLCNGIQIEPEDLALLSPGGGASPFSLTSPMTSGQFHAQVKQFKQATIKAALHQTGGNQTKAAELLGLRRTHLVRMLRVLSIREQ